MASSELKTLKDLDFKLSDSEAKILFKKEFIEKELKQEAIKWYRSIYENNQEVDSPAQPLLQWICKFFNLTAEDLK